MCSPLLRKLLSLGSAILALLFAANQLQQPEAASMDRSVSGVSFFLLCHCYYTFTKCFIPDYFNWHKAVCDLNKLGDAKRPKHFSAKMVFVKYSRGDLVVRSTVG